MLAVKLMMQRIRSEVQADPSSANITKCAGEIHNFFEKNQKIAGADLDADLPLTEASDTESETCLIKGSTASQTLQNSSIGAASF